jgi:hypothetical protein
MEKEQTNTGMAWDYPGNSNSWPTRVSAGQALGVNDAGCSSFQNGNGSLATVFTEAQMTETMLQVNSSLAGICGVLLV